MKIVWVLLSLLAAASALTQEQAGNDDWMRSHMGHISSAVFHPDASIKHVYVASAAAGTVGALHVRTGEMLWRAVLARGEDVQTLAVLSGAGAGSGGLDDEDEGVVAAVTDGGKYLRAWRTKDGVPLWDDILLSRAAEPLASDIDTGTTVGDGASTDVVANIAEIDRTHVAVGVHDMVDVRLARTGKAVWSWDEPNGRTIVALAPTQTKKHLVAVTQAADASSPLQVVTLLVEGDSAARVVDTSTVDGVSAILGAAVVRARDGAIVLLADGNKLVTIVNGKVSTSTVDVPATAAELVAADEHVAVVRTADSPVNIAVSLASNAIVAQADAVALGRTPAGNKASPNGALALAIDVDGVRGALSGRGLWLGADNAETGAFQTDAVTADGAADGVPVLAGATHVTTAAVQVVSLTQEPFFRVRALVITDDATATMIADGAVKWARSEALAQIDEIEFVDLPLENLRHRHGSHRVSDPPTIVDAIDSVVDGVGTTIERLQSLAADVADMDLVALLSGEGLVRKHPVKTPQDQMTQDAFGLRQMLVVRTASGRIFGIHSETGHTMWTFRPAFDPELATIRFMWTTRTAEVFEPQVTLVIETVDASAPVALVRFNPLTGQPSADAAGLAGEPLDAALPHNILFGKLLASEQDEDTRLNPFMLVLGSADAPSAHVFPASTDVASVLFFLADAASNELRGFDALLTAGKVEHTWTVALPSAERLATVALNSDPSEMVAEPRVIGTRVMYASVNNDVIAVGTVAAPDASTDALTFYFIDAAQGTIVRRFVHKHCTGPVHAVLDKNMLVYHYWNSGALRHEMSVAELYLSAPEWTPITGSWETIHAIANDEDAVVVMQQTYLFPSAVTALGMSRTARDVTSKQLLVGMGTDSLLALSTNYINAMRPTTTKLSAEQKAEGFMPYKATLPIDPLSVISYGQQVAAIRRIQATDAVLESASLVAAYGLDLFFARTSPSKPFDMLNKDFHYVFLFVTIGGLAVATSIVTALVRRKNLLFAWQ